MACIDFGSEALNKVYGGMLCNSTEHSQNLHNLPLTGFNALDIVILGLLLFLVGLPLYINGKKF